MKNEIEKRKEGNILYEPPEPLFPELPSKKRMRIRLVRLLALFIVLAVSAFIWVISAAGKSGEGGDTGVPGLREESDEEQASPSEGETESETEERYESESESESESVTETEADTESTSDVEPAPFVERDLSMLEAGLGYVINYSNKHADISGLIDRGFLQEEKRGGAAPLVLVIHTHTGEEYQREGSLYKGPVSVVSVGDVLVSRLNSMGVGAVHCSVIHDGKGENAYKNAEETVKMMREIYPSLKYVIDVHRMELYENGSIVKTVSGCPDGAAQIRLSVGADDVGDSWQEELSLSLELRRNLNRGGVGICMPVVITPRLSGLEMGEYYVMAEVGSLGNSVEEAMAAGERLARAIAAVLLE